MTADSHLDAASNALLAVERSPPPKLSKTYGYIWADWLYAHDKDTFMVEVYNNCKDIDGCTESTEKAAKLLLLRNKVKGSKKAWVEGVLDFIDFESQVLADGIAPLDVLDDTEEYRTLAILHAAYLHGAFRGVCRTTSGAEWISDLGEFCAAAVHQGFKWLRVSGGVDDWELPALGESWCRGAALWGLVALYMALDVAGADPGNDIALERIQVVTAAHHIAGFCWMKYRGAHPHKWWSLDVGGTVPSEVSIRKFGEKHGWPDEMTDILSRAAKHASCWKNLPFNPVHLERTRGLLIWDHTPRLKNRLMQVADELVPLVGNVTDFEAEEILSRLTTWMTNHSAVWRGRGDRNDRVVEISLIGAILGVLRESRSHVSSEFTSRAMAWSKERLGHLCRETQDLSMRKILRCIQIRGRTPGAVDGYASEGTGTTRWFDGFWEIAELVNILGHPAGGREFPEHLRGLDIRFFHAMTKKRRIAGRDFRPGSENQDCPVCVGDSLFEGLVDNRSSAQVWLTFIWGEIIYHNLGLGSPDDTDIGCG